MGRSLGVDIIPPKVCTLDCVYCQLGRTPVKSTTRRDFGDVDPILSELADTLASGVTADYVTIGGSGEPTLHCRLGELIDRIRPLTTMPIALLTNGTLFDRPDVRAEAGKADVVIPSLDAGDEAVFQAVNRPAPGINIENVVSGLSSFREEFAGQIWLEVFLIEAMNTDAEQIARLRERIGKIRPDKIQLNSAVRPAAEEGIEPIRRERLEAIARQVGGHCEIIGAAPAVEPTRHQPAGLCGRAINAETQALFRFGHLRRSGNCAERSDQIPYGTPAARGPSSPNGTVLSRTTSVPPNPSENHLETSV